MAGLPQQVIDRAREILRNLESGEYESQGQPRLARRQGKIAEPLPQMSLFDGGADAVKIRLDEIDVSVLTPLEALNLLDELKRLIT